MVLSKRILIIIFLVILAMAAFAFWNFYDLSTTANGVDQILIQSEEEVPYILDTTEVYKVSSQEAEQEQTSTRETTEEITNGSDTEQSEDFNSLSESQMKYYTLKTTNLQSRNELAIALLTEFYNDFGLNQGNLSQEEIDSIESDYQIDYTTVSAEYQNIGTLIGDLQNRVTTATTNSQANLVSDINSISDDITKFQESIRAKTTKHYTALSKGLGQERYDLMVSNIKVDFIPSDNEEITLSITFNNVGDKEMKDKFTYYSNFTINGELVDTCRKEVDRLSPFDEEQLTCEVSIKDQYKEFKKGKTDFLSMKLMGMVDSNIEIKEISEENNNFVWELDMTLAEFN